MKKFKVEIVRNAYQSGTYELEAPDEDAAYVLAQDIGFNDQRITWQEYTHYAGGYPRAMDIGITEAECPDCHGINEETQDGAGYCPTCGKGK